MQKKEEWQRVEKRKWVEEERKERKRRYKRRRKNGKGLNKEKAGEEE